MFPLQLGLLLCSPILAVSTKIPGSRRVREFASSLASSSNASDLGHLRSRITNSGNDIRHVPPAPLTRAIYCAVPAYPFRTEQFTIHFPS